MAKRFVDLTAKRIERSTMCIATKKLSVKEKSESALRQQEIIKIIITDRFYIALVSALEQTHCAHM